MRVELARTAGFCYGVRRAVQLAEEARPAKESKSSREAKLAKNG